MKNVKRNVNTTMDKDTIDETIRVNTATMIVFNTLSYEQKNMNPSFQYDTLLQRRIENVRTALDKIADEFSNHNPQNINGLKAIFSATKINSKTLLKATLDVMKDERIARRMNTMDLHIKPEELVTRIRKLHETLEQT